MNNLYLNRISVPIVTGTPQPQKTPQPAGKESGTQSFQALLQAQLAQGGVEFSKHAVSRVMERNIELSGGNLERLNEGVKIAREKGLDDALILVDNTAFIVSAKNSKVITTVEGSDLRGNCFTNIDGTVII